MTVTRDMIQLQLIADLKASPVAAGAQAFVSGKTAPSDGLGGLYRWDPTSTAAEDMTFLNAVVSDQSATGRWVRVFQRVQQLPHGILVNTGGMKAFYAKGVTAADGTASIRLTLDNNDSGAPIFQEILSNVATARTTAQSAGDAVQAFRMAEDLKSTKHGFSKANAVTMTLGLLLMPVAMVGAGVNVNFKIEGI